MHSTVAFALLLLASADAGAFSLVEAVAASPGQMVEVPAGVHEIAEPLIFRTDGGGLYGVGTIVQTDPAQAVVRVDGAANVRIEGVTLSRPEGMQQSMESALRVENAKDLVVDGVRVLGNHSQSAAIRLDGCERAVIRDCEVRDYKTVGIDDRTTSPLYGYAFRCIDGAGIGVSNSVHTTIAGNRIIETRLLPTQELKAEHQLGTLCDGREPLKPGELARGVAERGYVDNWHQGSALVVTGPEQTRHTQIQGNLIVNAAQGIDMHCDYANVSGNVIDRCMIGIKGTHGCYGVVVSGNTVTGADLWGMIFNPGAGSHGGEPKEAGGEARPRNADAGLLIANNLIADYGHGNEYWNWGGREADAPSSYGIALMRGQLDTNPPLDRVLLTGNMVLAGGRETAADAAPRYRYAVYVESWENGERTHPTAALGVVFSGNQLDAGLLGVSNVAVEAR